MELEAGKFYRIERGIEPEALGFEDSDGADSDDASEAGSADSGATQKINKAKKPKKAAKGKGAAVGGPWPKRAKECKPVAEPAKRSRRHQGLDAE